MNSPLISVLIISLVVAVVATVAAVRSEKLRATLSGVAGAGFAAAVTALLFLVADKESRRNIKARGLVDELKEAELAKEKKTKKRTRLKA